MKKLTCFRCGEEICFDPNKKAESGKSIPLDPITNEPHNCSRSKFTPRKSLGDHVMEQEERDRETIRRIKYD
jgi:hypothetical protein